ncbi:hypothetical protein ABES80_08635 [Bacillus gobiensis]|uniref:hypothetical protein n=1 Tax=Bacillus gobiensis TaxID=1441095 RepID=UPI003D236ECD
MFALRQRRFRFIIYNDKLFFLNTNTANPNVTNTTAPRIIVFTVRSSLFSIRSKEELIHAAIQRYVKEEFDYFERLTESDKPFKEQFQLLIKRSHETGENILSEALKDAYSKNSSTKAMVDKYYEQLMPKISKWIQAGQSENVINPNVSIDTIMLYFNIWQNAMGQVLEMVEEKDLPRVKLELETLILHGIMKQ